MDKKIRSCSLYKPLPVYNHYYLNHHHLLSYLLSLLLIILNYAQYFHYCYYYNLPVFIIYYLSWEGTGTETDLTGALEMSGDLDLRCWTPLESCPFWWRTIFLAGPVSQQVGSVVSFCHSGITIITGLSLVVGRPWATPLSLSQSTIIIAFSVLIILLLLRV